MSFILAFFVMMALLAIGDMVSARTKAIVPSVFISASLFVLGFWTGVLPRDVMDLAGFGTAMWSLAMYLIIGHMGTLLSLKELGRQWKSVAIAVAGLLGMCAMELGIAKAIIGWNAVVVGTPPLAGGLVATIMMGEAAKAKALGDLALLAPAIFVVQSFIGYPLTAICLRREGIRLLKARDAGELAAGDQVEAPEIAAARPRMIPPLPEKFQTAFTHLAVLGFIGWFGLTSAGWLKSGLMAINPAWGAYSLHPLVVTLLIGAFAAEIGLVERKALDRASCYGFIMAVVMCLVMSMLKESTPQAILSLLWSLSVILLVGVVGIVAASAIVGKILGYSVPISIALSLTALYGFPPNYILTEEACKGLANTREDFTFLMDRMLPRMLIGGFVTVTISSVILAGVFVNLL